MSQAHKTPTAAAETKDPAEMTDRQRLEAIRAEVFEMFLKASADFCNGAEEHRSNMETMLWRLKLQGRKADTSDIRTGALYKNLTMFETLREICDRIDYYMGEAADVKDPGN